MAAEDIGKKKYLTPEEFFATTVSWSRKTLERRIKEDGFPAIRDGNSWLIDPKEADLWFKKRKYQNT